MDPVALRLLPMSSSVGEDGHLSVGGLDLVDLAEQFGTPLFVYDVEHIRARAREAVGAWGEGVAYGTKAFLCRAMARLVAEEGMCLDVSTGGEMAVALSAGVPPDRLVVHGNNKLESELEMAVTSGVRRVVVDSFDEMDRLERIACSLGRVQKVLVRVTPGVEAHTHAYTATGQVDSKFGFGLASGDAERALKRARSSRGMELVGVHAHIGSQVFRVDAFCREVEVLAPLVAAYELEELCVGGGLGVAYVEGEAAPSLTEWADAAREAARAAGVPESTSITAEPGRSIVADAAVTLYRVGTIKELPGVRTYVAVDGGMSDNPRPVLYGSGYEAFLPREAQAPRPRVVRVVGRHCESGDVIVNEAKVPVDLRVGDVIATPVTGAYGYSMASTYNRVPRPAVVFVSEGTAQVVLRRETDEDLMALEV